MNPLLVHYNNHFNTPVGIRNISNISNTFNCDIVSSVNSPAVLKKISLSALENFGNFYWHAISGYLTFPVQTAVKYKIPLIIWGENSQQEYGGPNLDSVKNTILNRKWLEEFGGLLGNRVQDMIGVNGITEKELTPYFYPSDEDIETPDLENDPYAKYYEDEEDED